MRSVALLLAVLTLCGAGFTPALVWPHGTLAALAILLAVAFPAILAAAVIQSRHLRGRHRKRT